MPSSLAAEDQVLRDILASKFLHFLCLLFLTSIFLLVFQVVVFLLCKEKFVSFKANSDTKSYFIVHSDGSYLYCLNIVIKHEHPTINK